MQGDSTSISLLKLHRLGHFCSQTSFCPRLLIERLKVGERKEIGGMVQLLVLRNGQVLLIFPCTCHYIQNDLNYSYLAVFKNIFPKKDFSNKIKPSITSHPPL